MDNLKVVSINGQLVTESREVAVMIGKNHADLLRDIRGYVETLGKSSFASADFFVESNYIDTQGKPRACYQLTKKGCEMVGNKMTGEKGVLFTAAYVTRFEDMEKTLNAPRVLTEQEQLEASLKLTLMNSNDVKELKVEVTEIRSMVENQITLDHSEQRGLQKAIGRKVFEYAKSDDHKRLLYPELHREIKDRFGVTSYKDVKRQDLTAAIGYVNAWIPKRTA